MVPLTLAPRQPHGTSQGKATAAVLIPTGCLFLGLLLFVILAFMLGLLDAAL
jgi:hypothetical protein